MKIPNKQQFPSFLFKYEPYDVNKLLLISSFPLSKVYHKEPILFVKAMYSILKHMKKKSGMNDKTKLIEDGKVLFYSKVYLRHI